MSILAQLWIAVLMVALPIAGVVSFLVLRRMRGRFATPLERVFQTASRHRSWEALRATVDRRLERERTEFRRTFDEMAKRLEVDVAARKTAENDLAKANEELEKRVEERTALLKDSEAKYRIVAHHTHASEFWRNPEGELVYLSPSCQCITGYSAAEFMADADLFYRVIHPADRHLFERSPLIFQDGESCDFECRIVDKAGAVRWIHHVRHNLIDDEGTFLGTAGSNREITAETLLKQQLLHSLDKLGTLTAELSLSEERERRRIALTLHDGVVQNLATGKLMLEVALQKGELASHPALRELQRTLDASMRDLRDLSADLSPPILYDLGLGAALVSLGEKLAKKFAFRFVFHPGYEKEDFCENLKISVFQFFRELLMNVVKHADAAIVTVLLRREGDRLILSVDDDGKGFDMTESHDGFGLANIRQRVHYLRGELKMKSLPKIGTRVVISVDHGNGCRLNKNNEVCGRCERHAR